MVKPRALIPLVIPLAVLPAMPAAAGDPAGGERVFQKCYACHSVRAGEKGLPGPNLRTVFGRRAGSLPDFTYSKAMAEADLVWNETQLDTFLANPQAVVPGTEMGFIGLRKANERADVIAFLKQAGGHE